MGAPEGVSEQPPENEDEDDPNEPPEELTCPITYTLFRDPVTCVADGRVYEREGLVSFWRHRPLADFLGGPQLPHARMEPASAVRDGVRSWLDAHPDVTPNGWASRS